MNTIKIKTFKASPKVLAALEKKGLIRVVKPTPKVVNTRTRTGAVDYFYRSPSRQGGHCLLAVGKRNTEIEFSFHPGNEDLIHIKPENSGYKPLFFITSYLKSGVFIRALKKGVLRSRDFAAVEVKFNDPATSVFTVLKDTVHCEITLPGRGRHPVFFVTEPARLKMNILKTKQYKFELE